MDNITLNSIYDDILTIKQQLIYIRENTLLKNEDDGFSIKVLGQQIDRLTNVNKNIRQVQDDLFSIHGSLLHESKYKGY